jgi:hypothetical protein
MTRPRRGVLSGNAATKGICHSVPLAVFGENLPLMVSKRERPDSD